MPYLGRPLISDKTTKTKKIDNIASSFNSAQTVFSLTSSGASVYPASSRNLFVSINGVLQEPDVAYTINAATITFTSAPTTGATFFCVVNGEPNDLLLTPAVSSMTVGANVSVNTSTVFVGNSTANVSHTATSFAVANSTNTATLTPVSFTIGTQVANTLGFYAGANVSANTTVVFVGNSTANTVRTATSFAVANSTNTATLTATSLTIGGTIANTTALVVPATAKIYLDGGGDTYITESVANYVEHYVGGTQRLSLSTTALTSTVPVLAPDGSAAAPSYSFASQASSGWYKPAETKVALSLAGTAYWVFDAGNSVLSARSTQAIGWSSGDPTSQAADVRLSRGAANRLDLASGDSFYLVSGGLGVGVPNTNAGTITSSAGITAGTFLHAEVSSSIGWGASRSLMSSPANGQQNFTNNAATAGIGFDFATDGVLKIRNRAQTAYGNITTDTLDIGESASANYPRLRNNSNQTLNIVSGADTNVIVVKAAAYSSPSTTGTRVSNDAQAVANDAVISLGATTMGFAFITDDVSDTGAIIYLVGGSNSVRQVSNPDSFYSVTKDTPSRINIYYDTNGYYLQNKRGSSITVRIVVVG